MQPAVKPASDGGGVAVVGRVSLPPLKESEREELADTSSSSEGEEKQVPLVRYNHLHAYDIQ